MKEEKYLHLIYLQSQGALSSDEKQELQDWLAESADRQKIEEEISKSLNLLDDYEPNFEVDVKSDYAKMRKQMDFGVSTNAKKETTKVVGISSRRKWMSVAATVALLITASFFFWNQKSPPLEWTAFETKMGETQSITLEDGTQVWLNENTRFSYPKSFTGDRRPVELAGEAFFDVAKNADKPFEINTAISAIKVLGTSFNLRAYGEEPTTTITVKSGKVQFIEKEKENSVMLTQNQEAVILHETKQISTNKKADMNALAWQTNHLRFKNRSLTDVFEIMERHFRIEIDCTNEALKNCKFSSPKEYNLESIFTKLTKFYNIEVSSDGAGGYIVKGGGC